jgi:hypothetical protein
VVRSYETYPPRCLSTLEILRAWYIGNMYMQLLKPKVVSARVIMLRTNGAPSQLSFPGESNEPSPSPVTNIADRRARAGRREAAR